ncbi:hypothetical protein RUM44_012393 [Polyplax serrata]|uniref:Uncharacterized protein n=1 Tax=Polyplax serrata TaxID=468196 RepID=A0ABR1BB56_POLSC
MKTVLLEKWTFCLLVSPKFRQKKPTREMQLTKCNQQNFFQGSEDSRPWWFPPDKKILSRKSNLSLSEFPKKIEATYGGGQPCDILETVFLPIYMSQCDFYDDGSLLVYPTQMHGFHTQKVSILFDPMSYCIDRLELKPDYQDEPMLDFSDTADYLIMLCPCTKATCVLKCCPPGMLIDIENMQDRENACVRSPPEEEDWTPNYTKLGNHSRDYFLLHRFPVCNPGEGTVIPNQFKIDGHTIYSNGSAHIFGETHMSQPLKFCGENFIAGRGDEKVYNHIIRCYPEAGIRNTKSDFRRILYGCLFVVGAVFLLATLLVHGLLPARSNINDKNLISQTWGLFIGYLCIAISQLGMNKLSQSVCILLDSVAILAYFYGPIAVLLSLNVLLFLHTLYRINQAQKDIQNVIKNSNPEKQRFILYMKLLLLMGLPWIAELISWMVGGPSYYWYLTDIINLLRAVFIFAVFCCKKQVIIEIKRRFGILHQPHIRRPSMPRTNSSFFVSTQCQDPPKGSNSAVSSL